MWELREAVAELYNARYRKGMPTRYSAENVAIASGGRTALTRVGAALDQSAARLAVMLPSPKFFETRQGSAYLSRRTATIVARMSEVRVP
jgi:aspartate/methionine/tyrosine aminotransferase